MNTKMTFHPRTMGLLATVLLAAGLFSGCDYGKNGDEIPLGNRTVQSFEFEGCEYLYIRRYGSIAIEHKGNCKHCHARLSPCR